MDSNYQQIEKNLEYSFLYDNDPDSMYILLSINEYRYRTYNLQPSYRLMQRVSQALKRHLSARRDREYILRALRFLVNDDLYRFELAVVIEGYSRGLRDSFWVDKLERTALTEFSENELISRSILYHQAAKGRSIAVKSMLFHELKIRSEGFRALHSRSTSYSRKVLRRKIYRLNDYIDQQVMIDFDNITQVKPEESVLTLKDLKTIYQKINRYIYNNVTKIYKEAYWYGVNDAVLERYV